MEIHIREQPLPGIGARFEITMEDAQRLVLVARRDGRREIGTITAGSGDEPTMLLSLTRDQAVAVAAILMGARFALDANGDTSSPDDETVVETVALPEGARTVGEIIKDVRFPDDSGAAVLAVIRDETPALIENEATETLRPGDRVVIAARRELLEHAIHQLTSLEP